jgi:hypothetical protein
VPAASWSASTLHCPAGSVSRCCVGSPLSTTRMRRAGSRAIEFLPSDGKVVAWTIDGSVARDPARRILVVLNGEPTQQRLTLPAGQWSVLADHDAAGTEPQGKVSGTATLEAWSILVATQ